MLMGERRPLLIQMKRWARRLQSQHLHHVHQQFIWAEDIVDHGGEASALLLRSGRAPQPHLADASSYDWADDWAEALSLEAEAFDVERGEGRLGLDA